MKASKNDADMINCSPDVRIVEVGPRDGLQNEAIVLSVESKRQLVENLADAGLRFIEAGSFVAPRWVPQMASSDRLFATLQRREGVVYSALTPNLQGLQGAIQYHANEVAVFTAASEAFTRKNINCSIEESLQRFAPVLALARSNGLKVRGYLSCVMGCPYAGPVALKDVISLVGRLLTMGCYEVSLGDTIGIGTSRQVHNLLSQLLQEFPVASLAVHFHDTYGQALANIDRSLELGIRTIDASVAGLGGCPYAKGASGNVATEDVVYMLHGNGLTTGIDLNRLISAGHQICTALNRPSGSKVALARGYPA
jgi:hydroxymethylglutaryl-CoA lyase